MLIDGADSEFFDRCSFLEEINDLHKHSLISSDLRCNSLLNWGFPFCVILFITISTFNLTAALVFFFNLSNKCSKTLFD
jgi:hypothetical protein